MKSTKVKNKKVKISDEEKREKIRDALMKKKSIEENSFLYPLNQLVYLPSSVKMNISFLIPLSGYYKHCAAALVALFKKKHQCYMILISIFLEKIRSVLILCLLLSRVDPFQNT